MRRRIRASTNCLGLGLANPNPVLRQIVWFETKCEQDLNDRTQQCSNSEHSTVFITSRACVIKPHNSQNLLGLYH